MAVLVDAAPQCDLLFAFGIGNIGGCHTLIDEAEEQARVLFRSSPGRAMANKGAVSRASYANCDCMPQRRLMAWIRIFFTRRTG